MTQLKKVSSLLFVFSALPLAAQTPLKDLSPQVPKLREQLRRIEQRKLKMATQDLLADLERGQDPRSRQKFQGIQSDFQSLTPIRPDTQRVAVLEQAGSQTEIKAMGVTLDPGEVNPRLPSSLSDPAAPMGLAPLDISVVVPMAPTVPAQKRSMVAGPGEKGPQDAWFSAHSSEYQSVEPLIGNNDGDQLQTHLFFDFDPSIDQKSKTLSVVITTFEKSPNFYELDLASGQLYLQHAYCAQTGDAWNKYKKKIETPPYSIGFVPRVLDQLGRPQKVIVFGAQAPAPQAPGLNGLQQFQATHAKQRPLAQEVRIVGGMLQQECDLGPCIGPGKWHSRLVLIGVDPKAEAFKKTLAISDLSAQLDLPHVLASLQNLDGRNLDSVRQSPAVRVVGKLWSNEAMRALQDKSFHFTKDKAWAVRDACHRLYDESYALHAKGGALMDPLVQFHKNHGKRLNRCFDWVKISEFKKNQDKHRWLVALQGFYNALKVGAQFDCHRLVWNIEDIHHDDMAKKASYQNFPFARCSEKELGSKAQVEVALQSAFAQISYPQKYAQSIGRHFYQYIDWDNRPQGTHERLYSWVRRSGKKLACSDEKLTAFNQNLTILPSDFQQDMGKLFLKNERELANEPRTGKSLIR